MRRRLVEEVPFAPLLTGAHTIAVASHADLNPGVGDFSVGGWFRVMDADSYSGIAGKGLGGANPTWYVYWDYTTQSLQFSTRTAATSKNCPTAANTAPLGRWLFWCARRDAATMYLSINAGAVKTAAQAALDVDNAESLYLNRVVAGPWNLTGMCNDLFWLKGTCMTQDQIDALFYEGTYPTGCVKWGCREGALTTCASSPAGYDGTLSAASWTTLTRGHARI